MTFHIPPRREYTAYSDDRTWTIYARSMLGAHLICLWRFRVLARIRTGSVQAGPIV